MKIPNLKVRVAFNFVYLAEGLEKMSKAFEKCAVILEEGAADLKQQRKWIKKKIKERRKDES